MSNADSQQQPRQQLLEQIIEAELHMFLNTVNEGGQASCQKNPNSFRIMRWMNHCTHEEATLLSYLNDLHTATQAGRNLMFEKYARMDNLIPPLSTNPHITSIVETEYLWLQEEAKIYPHALQGQGKFKVYLSAELETMSDATLELYAQEIVEALKAGRNLALERHDLLCKRLGYTSLADRNAQLSAKIQ